MRSIIGFIIRASAFVGKELSEVLRQTRLILTLVLGPFLIMLLFGVGYRNEARALRTIFIINENNPFRQQVESFAENLGPQLIYMGITSDQAEALRKLARGEVDVAVEVPRDAYESIRNSEQSVFTLYHNEIDPYQASYVQYFGSAYIDEVNRRLLRSIAEEGQQEAADVQYDLQAAQQSTKMMREALERKDSISARSEQQQLNGRLDALSLAVGGSLGLLQGVKNTVGDGSESGVPAETDEVMTTLSQLDQNRSDLGTIEDDQTSYEREVQELQEMESNLGALQKQLTDFRRVDSAVLVAPFRSDTQSIGPVNLTPTGFFAPAVIVLLLQHLAVTFAALSIVRERRSGAMELFRISPLSSIEVIVGKYLSYLFFGSVIALITTVTVVFGLKVPMLGDWGIYALITLILLFTALGLGFIISLISQTDTQAVQFSMFILLGSVFFSGFFLDLRYLWEPIRVVSWALPATYGIRMLQDIMLRGVAPAPILFAGLIGIGAFLFLIVWLLLRRQMRQE